MGAHGRHDGAFSGSVQLGVICLHIPIALVVLSGEQPETT
jgi:hypothetical protein